MVTIIHGDDIVSSRNFFLAQKQNYQEVHSVDATSLSVTYLSQILESKSLFALSGKTGLFIEGVFTKIKSPNDLSAILSSINTYKGTTDIYLWETKEISKKSLAQLPISVIKLFKTPQAIFPFLDSLKPGVKETAVKLFHASLSASEPEVVFAMLVRHIRLLLAVQDAQGNPIDELKRMMDWQTSKLLRQSQAFTKDALCMLHQKLFLIEKQQKTGILPMSLEGVIDIFLLGI